MGQYIIGLSFTNAINYNHTLNICFFLRYDLEQRKDIDVTTNNQVTLSLFMMSYGNIRCSIPFLFHNFNLFLMSLLNLILLKIKIKTSIGTIAPTLGES